MKTMAGTAPAELLPTIPNENDVFRKEVDAKIAAATNPDDVGTEILGNTQKESTTRLVNIYKATKDAKVGVSVRGFVVQLIKAVAERTLRNVHPLIAELFRQLNNEEIDDDSAAYLFNFLKRYADDNTIDFSAGSDFEEELRKIKMEDPSTFGFVFKFLENIDRGAHSDFFTRLQDFNPTTASSVERRLSVQQKNAWEDWRNDLNTKLNNRRLKLDDPVTQQLIGEITNALTMDDQTMNKLYGVTVEEFIKDQLKSAMPQGTSQVEIDNLYIDILGGRLQDMQKLERAYQNASNLPARNIEEVSRHWHDYRKIAEVMGRFYIDRPSIYEEILEINPDTQKPQVAIRTLKKLQKDSRDVVNTLFRALQANPGEQQDLYQPLREGNVLNAVVRIFIDASDESKIRNFLESKNFNLTQSEREKMVSELSKNYMSIARDMLANKDIQQFGANVHQIMMGVDLERLPQVFANFPVEKFKAMFLRNPYAQMAPHLWEAFLDKKIMENGNVVPSDLFTSTIDKIGASGERLDPSQYDIKYKTKEEFIDYQRRYFKSIGFEPSNADLEESFIVARTFTAMLMRTPSQFSRTIPRQDFQQNLYGQLVEAIDARFRYGEELGSRSLQKGDNLRTMKVAATPHMDLPKTVGEHLQSLFTNPHNPRRRTEEGDLHRSKGYEFLIPIELRKSMNREQLYFNDNMSDLNIIVRQASMGDFFQEGWRTKMFENQYTEDMKHRRRLLFEAAKEQRQLGNIPQAEQLERDAEKIDVKFQFDEDVINWCRTRGGVLVEFVYGDKFAEQEAGAYLKQMAKMNHHIEQHGAKHAMESEIIRRQVEAYNNDVILEKLGPYMGYGELAEEKVLEIVEVDDNDRLYKRSITHNEFKFRSSNANRGRAWYHESLVNPAQYLMGLEHLFSKELQEGYVQATLINNGVEEVRLIPAAEFYMSDNYDGPIGLRLSDSDAKKRRSFRSQLVDIFESEDCVKEISYLMNFYTRVYDAFDQQYNPNDIHERNKKTIGEIFQRKEDVRKMARNTMFDSLIAGFGRGRYERVIRNGIMKDDRSANGDGATELEHRHIFSSEEQTELTTLLQRSASSLTNDDRNRIRELEGKRIIADLFFSQDPNNEGLIIHNKQTIGNEQAYFGKKNARINGNIRGSNPPDIGFDSSDYGNLQNPDKLRYLGDSISFFHRLGYAHSEKRGVMSAPTFDFDTVAAAGHGDTSGEQSIARHATNYKPMKAAQDAISKFYKVTKYASGDHNNPFKQVFEAFDIIKGAFRDTKDETTGKELNAQLMQIALEYLLKDDRNRFPLWSGDLMMLLLGRYSSISRASQGPGSVEINRDDLVAFLHTAVRDSLIPHEAEERILRKFNATKNIFWLTEGVPNGLALFTLLSFVLAVKEAVEEMEGIGGGSGSGGGGGGHH